MRNKKTSFLLEEISNAAQEQNDFELHMTLNVGGQLITGIVISETSFFDLEENKCLNELYDGFKEARSEHFNDAGTLFKEGMSKEDMEAVPDFFCQHFLYLKNASYVMTDMLVPTGGASIQVRVADVYSFSIGSLITNNS